MKAATLIIQSAPVPAAAWLERCMATVSSWAAAAGHDYRRLDDILFHIVPADIVARLTMEARIPLSDIARLLWMARALDEGWSHVAWIDSDVLLFDPAGAVLPPPLAFQAGREYWVWAEDGNLLARDTVTNAMLAATTRAGFLDWYVGQALHILRAAPLPIHRLALGPQLLTTVHAQAPIPLIASMPTLSPMLIEEVIAGGGPGLTAHRAAWTTPAAGAHLCRSLGFTADGPALIAPDRFDPVIDRLLADGKALLNG